LPESELDKTQHSVEEGSDHGPASEGSESAEDSTDAHAVVTEYAEELLDAPRAHLILELSQDEEGLKLAYRDRLLVECRLTRQGMAAGAYMARALGVRIPPLGETVRARVSTGVLFRAMSIASLDFDEEASMVVLSRLLEEAEMQRGGVSEL
jgi:hypothetical protein